MQMQFSIETTIAILAAVAAGVSAYYAWQSTKISHRALKISEDEHRARHTGLSTYLINGVCWDDDSKDRLVSFACSLSNISSTSLSIVRANLHVHAFPVDKNSTELILRPEKSGMPSIWDLKGLVPPINLGARTTISGWIGYRIPEKFISSMTIDKYEIVFDTSTGERTTVTQYLLQRIENATRRD